MKLGFPLPSLTSPNIHPQACLVVVGWNNDDLKKEFKVTCELWESIQAFNADMRPIRESTVRTSFTVKDSAYTNGVFPCFTGDANLLTNMRAFLKTAVAKDLSIEKDAIVDLD